VGDPEDLLPSRDSCIAPRGEDLLPTVSAVWWSQFLMASHNLFIIPLGLFTQCMEKSETFEVVSSVPLVKEELKPASTA